MKPRIAPSGLRSRYCRGAYDDPAATGAGLLDAPFAPALRLPEPSETPPARPEKVRPGARPDKPAVPCPKGKLTGWSRAASARCRYGPSLEARLADDGAWYPGVSEEERRGKTRWLVRGSGARYGFLSLRLGRRAAERAIGAAATGVAPADCGGDADVLAPPPARDGGASAAGGPRATGGGREGAGSAPWRRLGPVLRRPRKFPPRAAARRRPAARRPVRKSTSESGALLHKVTSRRERGRVGWNERQ